MSYKVGSTFWRWGKNLYTRADVLGGRVAMTLVATISTVISPHTPRFWHLRRRCRRRCSGSRLATMLVDHYFGTSVRRSSGRRSGGRLLATM